MRLPVLFLYVLILTSYSESSCSTERRIDISSIEIPPHPRILMSDDDVEMIKTKIRTDSTVSRVHQMIIRESNYFLHDPPVTRRLDGIRLLEVSRECRRRVFYLSYAWRITGDRRYLHRAEKELLAVSNFRDWNPSHYLDAAEITMAVALGYDWLNNELSETTKQTLRSAIINLGIGTSYQKEYNWWLTADNNWNQVCNASMVFGALAIYDHDPELAKKVIERSIQSVRIPMREYGPDGTYPEGYMYWEYGTTFNALMIHALEHAFGSDFGLTEIPGFTKSSEYMLHMVGPFGLPFNYSDGDPEPLVNPAMYWFANRLQNSSLLYSEKLIFEDALHPYPDLPVLVLWAASIDKDSIKQPGQLMWSGRGKNPVALMRSSWDNDAIYVGIKGGSPNIGHGHMDIGSFVLDSQGVRWAVDLGKQDYTAVEKQGIDLWDVRQQSDRWKIFRYNNLSHNTLSFNRQFQRVDCYAPLKTTLWNDSIMSATIDMSACYKDASRAVRSIGILDKAYVVVWDEIEPGTSGSTVRWSMVTPANVEIINDRTAKLTQDGKTLWMYVASPEGPALATWSTDPPNDFDEPNEGTRMVGFELSLKARSRTQLQVVLTSQEPTEQLLKRIRSFESPRQ